MPLTSKQRRIAAVASVGVALLVGAPAWSAEAGPGQATHSVEGTVSPSTTDDSAPPPSTDSGAMRDSFVKEGQASCIRSARASLAARGVSLPDEKVEAYCSCAMARANEALTDSEIMALAALHDTPNAEPSPEIRSKLDAATSACRQEAM